MTSNTYDIEELDKTVKLVLKPISPDIDKKIIPNSYKISKVNENQNERLVYFSVSLKKFLSSDEYEGTLREMGPELKTKDVVIIPKKYFKKRGRRIDGHTKTFSIYNTITLD